MTSKIHYAERVIITPRLLSDLNDSGWDSIGRTLWGALLRKMREDGVRLDGCAVEVHLKNLTKKERAMV